MKNSIPKWATSLKLWASVAAAVIGLWAISPIIGLDLPRWTWKVEHDRDITVVSTSIEKLGEVAAANSCSIVEANRKRLRDDGFVIKDRAEPYKQKKKPVPQWIKERQRLNDENKRENRRQRVIKRCP